MTWSRERIPEPGRFEAPDADAEPPGTAGAAPDEGLRTPTAVGGAGALAAGGAGAGGTAGACPVETRGGGTGFGAGAAGAAAAGAPAKGSGGAARIACTAARAAGET